MKNVIHIIIIIVSCLVAGILGGKLNTTQRELAPSKEAISGMPLGGFQKFISDMEWMLFVNYLGSLNTVDESNVDEVSRRLERLMSHDPNLGKIYQEGALMISIADPEKTVEILTKACNNPHLKSNSQIPFYAGFVMVQHMKPPKYKEAIPFFKMAVDRSGGGEGFNNYYASYYYRAKAKVWSDGKFDDRHALLHVLYDSWLGDTRDENYVGGGTMTLKIVFLTRYGTLKMSLKTINQLLMAINSLMRLFNVSSVIAIYAMLVLLHMAQVLSTAVVVALNLKFTEYASFAKKQFCQVLSSARLLDKNFPKNLKNNQ